MRVIPPASRRDALHDMTEARIQVVIRLSASGVAAPDAIAEVEERTRSQVIRMLLREALEARAR